MNSKQYIEMFNSITNGIGNHLLSKFSKNQKIIIYNNVICNMIKEKPTEIISLFIVNVYNNELYRTSILESDDSFFIKNELSELTKSEQNKIDVLSFIRECWKELNNESKKFIKESMKTLVKLCELYLNEICK